jgi:hypothetical protein
VAGKITVFRECPSSGIFRSQRACCHYDDRKLIAALKGRSIVTHAIYQKLGSQNSQGVLMSGEGIMLGRNDYRDIGTTESIQLRYIFLRLSGEDND